MRVRVPPFAPTEYGEHGGERGKSGNAGTARVDAGPGAGHRKAGRRAPEATRAQREDAGVPAGESADEDRGADLRLLGAERSPRRRGAEVLQRCSQGSEP